MNCDSCVLKGNKKKIVELRPCPYSFFLIFIQSKGRKRGKRTQADNHATRPVSNFDPLVILSIKNIHYYKTKEKQTVGEKKGRDEH